MAASGRGCGRTARSLLYSSRPSVSTRTIRNTSRPPLLTESATPFEKAFYLYQKRLNERLVLPFTRYFYHKKDQPADIEWKARVKERNGVAARDIGGYRAYGEEGWNDEVVIGGRRGGFEGRSEVLHTAAERILTQTAGPNMNTWIVGHVPIGSLTIKPSAKFNREAEKVFYMKGRIMAGQVDLKGNEYKAEDFMWLTRSEIEDWSPKDLESSILELATCKACDVLS
ncbi:hypothetical protein DID88_009752 [Monilinia fructigena]|uniref:Large ribosomal subunit protein mL46 N-terminal domain-containing protein n=1 Tax=Monilinia fructigena TaxID=38457 RepID=A0A395IK51_9HELO|nr:hypothetical protein DID88_009752 [Monilinia fructigena]